MSDENLFTGILLRAFGVNSRMSARQVMQHLYCHELLDKQKVEQYVARREVEKLCRTGMGRCAAMARTAEKLNCSYAKIRALVYQKKRNKHEIRN